MKRTSFMAFVIFLVSMGCKSDTQSQSVTNTLKANGKDSTITFDGEGIGKLPPGWSAETGKWETSDDSSNTTFKMAANDGSAFNIAVVKNQYHQNVEVEARVKALLGDEDQGGGLIWRYINKNNYYIIRANPLENNIRLYKVVDGRRKQMESEDIKIQTGEWFTIKVVSNGNQMDCYYNGQKVFSSSDETFPGGGSVGFWSKADAVSLFDDLKITVLNDPNITPESSSKLNSMKPQTKKVLFVCEHGAGKSVVAAAYFNKIAKDRNLNWEATCRGTNPDEEIGNTIQDGLSSDNLPSPIASPQQLTSTDTSNVERIILFTKLPEELKNTVQTEDWSSLPNIEGKYEARRDALIKKINEFFDSLEKQK